MPRSYRVAVQVSGRVSVTVDAASEAEAIKAAEARAAALLASPGAGGSNVARELHFDASYGDAVDVLD